MFLKKFMQLIFLFFLLFFSILYFNFLLVASLNYFSLDLLKNLMYTVKFSFFSLFMLFMVCAVSTMVLCFSEIYMESYLNQKFLIYTTLFFFFMVYLILSYSGLTLMVGWDYLGLSSIFLIMFYSNKTTLYNSVLTIIHNRLGDLFLLLFLCYLYSNFHFYSFSFYFCDSMILVSLFICSLTKSAQFPFSSWLPAAMSAPTPISAMVHSSTLVTAGIFLILNFLSLCESPFYHFLIFNSLLSFFLGGLMANSELDFKKIVAFSTMSQVSMVYFFCFFSLELSITHMFFHSFFKSSLFCASGLIFLKIFSNQSLSFVNFNYSFFEKKIFFISLFCMSGLFFSSSFWSKDSALEMILTNFFFFFFFIMILGSIFTLQYSNKMFFCITSNGLSSIYSLKNTSSFFLFLYSTFSCFVWVIFYMFNISNFVPLNSMELLFLISIIFLALFKSLDLVSKLKDLSFFISFMKLFVFSYYNMFLSRSSDYFLFDNFFFDFKALKLVKNISITSKNFNLLSFFMIFFLINFM